MNPHDLSFLEELTRKLSFRKRAFSVALEKVGVHPETG
jgi:hypothetical protein